MLASINDKHGLVFVYDKLIFPLFCKFATYDINKQNDLKSTMDRRVFKDMCCQCEYLFFIFLKISYFKKNQRYCLSQFQNPK